MSINHTSTSESLLNRYNQKRDFSVTAEPRGRVHKKKTRGLKFVIQEHHASHLHFDFRLEWEGVLKSWSVPKGPVMDTSTKRLAVEVEDHPIEYRKFEGVIPKHEYGGGRVYIWDEGTWEPIGDADEGFRKGRLDFALKGGRLSGRWTMVRTRPNERQPLWLLFYRGGGKFKEFEMIENAAGEATGARGVAMRAAESKSRSTKKMVKVTAELSAPLPIDPKDKTLPQFIAPELPLLVEEAPSGDDWIHELKFDGYRVQARLKRDGRKNRVELVTRTGQNWAEKRSLECQAEERGPGRRGRRGRQEGPERFPVPAARDAGPGIAQAPVLRVRSSFPGRQGSPRSPAS
jgi:bifunctional non-homologous end joining protein LigD